MASVANAIVAGIKFIPSLFKIFQHEPYSNFMSQIAPTVRARVAQTGHIVIAYWYGELIGFDTAGNFVSLASKADTKAVMDSGVSNAYERIIGAYVNNSGNIVEAWSAGDTARLQALASVGIRAEQQGQWLIFYPPSPVASVTGAVTETVQSAISTLSSVVTGSGGSSGGGGGAVLGSSIYGQPESGGTVTPAQAGILSGNMMLFLIGGVIIYFLYRNK